MKQIRRGSHLVTSYNEGLVAFIYDDAHSARIRDLHPTILEGFGEDDASDPALGELARAGELAVFELQGDGELSIELVVGEPLAPAEVLQGQWSLPVQRARLHLPSGDLRIECYNNLQFDPYIEAGEEGARLAVSPDDYGLVLYRRNLLMDDEDEPWEYAVHVVVLVPGGGPTASVSAPMLRFPAAGA